MLRRLVDVLVAAAALVASSPLLVVILLVIIIDSPGSPFYRAWRSGRYGRLFRMWKFRTMRAYVGGPAITGAKDPRVTRVGRLLRRTKLDELPQFLNVLSGDMTLVGPRPEAPEIVELYTPRQRTVLQVKPGVTGWAQLHAGNEEALIPEGAAAARYYVDHLLPGKIDRDLEYQQHRTAASDARIVFATAGYVLRSLLAR